MDERSERRWYTHQVMTPCRRIDSLLFASGRHPFQYIHVLFVQCNNLEITLDATRSHRLGQDDAASIDLVRDQDGRGRHVVLPGNGGDLGILQKGRAWHSDTFGQILS